MIQVVRIDSISGTTTVQDIQKAIWKTIVDGACPLPNGVTYELAAKENIVIKDEDSIEPIQKFSKEDLENKVETRGRKPNTDK